MATNNSHDTKGPNTIVLRIKGRPIGLGPCVPKDNIGMNIRIKVLPTRPISSDNILERCDGLGIARVFTATIISIAPLDAIAVNIQIG
jgi:hypothetical protein